jgi:4-hydroxy-tetrahydrodipicolinate synthase
MPSFKPETLEMDEDGIRHDVRQMIKHGFFSFALIECSMTMEEERLFIEWCTDEAKGQIGVTAALHYPSLDEQIEMAKFAEHAGCTAIFLRYPTNYHPKSEEALYDYTKAICEATNLGVILFPSMKNDLPWPSQMPPKLLGRMAKIENVIGMKIGVTDLTWMDECFRTFGDEILISYPFDDAWAIFVRNYGQQWAGAGLYQAHQTVDDPREIRLFNLFREGRLDEASELYWKMEPSRRLEKEIFAETMIAAGVYSLQAWKFQAGLLGMTGGEMREPKPRFTRRDEDRIRQALLAAGLTITE